MQLPLLLQCCITAYQSLWSQGHIYSAVRGSGGSGASVQHGGKSSVLFGPPILPPLCPIHS